MLLYEYIPGTVVFCLFGSLQRFTGETGGLERKLTSLIWSPCCASPVTPLARFYGGFVFVEEEASIKCKGATITGNIAGEQGGGIYARGAGRVRSSCDLIANESPQGAAIYLTNVKSATFKNHTVADNVASGGSVVYVTESFVGAEGVTFESGVELQEDSSNRAIQLDGDTTLTAEGCVFQGWLGDTVIYHKSSVPGSLVLNSCDFSGSSAAMAVISPNSDAEIRNAVVSSRTFLNAGSLSNSIRLVDRALDCGDSNACGAGECVNSTLGVLCECLESSGCLDDGGELSLRLRTPPAIETVGADILYELMVSAASDGTTYAIWGLSFEADGLALDVVPSSGLLSPGGNVSITVTGIPVTQDVGGNLSSTFRMESIGRTSPEGGGSVKLEVYSTFYFCSAHEYAMPLVKTDDGRVVCEQCAAIEGEQGVDCEQMGATLTSLPIRQGYWRSNGESLVVRRCFNSGACKGATNISSSDDYCKHGYKGPCELQCLTHMGREHHQ